MSLTNAKLASLKDKLEAEAQEHREAVARKLEAEAKKSIKDTKEAEKEKVAKEKKKK